MRDDFGGIMADNFGVFGEIPGTFIDKIGIDRTPIQ